jgi:hypothetical protein
MSVDVFSCHSGASHGRRFERALDALARLRVVAEDQLGVGAHRDQPRGDRGIGDPACEDGDQRVACLLEPPGGEQRRGHRDQRVQGTKKLVLKRH